MKREKRRKGTAPCVRGWPVVIGNYLYERKENREQITENREQRTKRCFVIPTERSDEESLDCILLHILPLTCCRIFLLLSFYHVLSSRERYD